MKSIRSSDKHRFKTALQVSAWVAGLSLISVAAPSPVSGQTPTETTAAAIQADPFPLGSAGWGPAAGDGRFMSRWVEDWRGMRTKGTAPRLKDIPLPGAASLSISSEARWRYDAYDHAGLTLDKPYAQNNLRVLLGADLRFSSGIRAYAELGAADVDNWPDTPPANFRNPIALQQAFIEARAFVGPTLVGAMVGRQDFADGPRPFLSLADGPNLRRTWNGLRVYAHGRRFRWGAFDLRGTRLMSGWFDERIDKTVRLSGINGSFLVRSTAKGQEVYVDPFWYRTTVPNTRFGKLTATDTRDTRGARLRGTAGNLSFDWTVARQTGRYGESSVDAWGLFLVNSVPLKDTTGKPILSVRVDAASGGGAYRTGVLRDFNPLYGSSQYLSEGLLLSASNLLLVTPGITVSPAHGLDLTAEYGIARRLVEDDAVYAGLMRPYTGTEGIAGRDVGRLLRLRANWTAPHHVTVSAAYEHLSAGTVLNRIGRRSGQFASVGVTYRY